MAFSSANPNSLLEQTNTLLFPSESILISQIPLWMKFMCFEFPNTAAGRAMAKSRAEPGGLGGAGAFMLLSKLKAQIHVPAPVNFESTTANVYANTTTAAPHIVPTALSDLAAKGSDLLPQAGKDLLKGVSDLVAGVHSVVTTVLDSVGGVGFGSDLPPDNNDAVFQPSGPTRIFEIKLLLPCLSQRDSEKAGEIIRAFEALSLPTMFSTLSINTSKLFHPPVWVFGIGPFGMKYDLDWSGQPQLCVLQTVKSRKTAFDTNSLAAIGSNFKPVGYTVSLIFKELEPAIRQMGIPGSKTSFTITNRSGALTSSLGGVSVNTI